MLDIGIIGVVVAVLGLGSYLYFGRNASNQISSIVVMPFVNESGDANVDYLQTAWPIYRRLDLNNFAPGAMPGAFSNARYAGFG